MLFLAWLPLLAGDEAVRDGQVVAQLVAKDTAWVPGQSHWVAIRLQHDAKWHTYWVSSATGYATSIEWDLPDGITAGPILWPVPIVYESMGYVEYVYEDEVLLPILLTFAQDFQPTAELRLAARVEWLMCTDTSCVPGGVDLTLSRPVMDSTSGDPEWAEAFTATFANIPTHDNTLPMAAYRAGDAIWLTISGRDGIAPKDLYFFDTQVLILPELSQTIRTIDGKWVIELTVDPAGVGTTDRLRGTLFNPNGWGAYGVAVEVDIAWTEGRPDLLTSATGTTSSRLSLTPGVLLFALLGGLILNLMPCVFPVIGIKIMGFVKQAGEARGKVVMHGLVFTAGVLASFWLLAALLIALRQGGQELGWGFQLQSPAFVYILTVLLFVFGLNMSGVFEVGQSAVGVGHNLTGKSGYTGSFFSGVLATVVATPCAAPFLAPALGAALALPAIDSLIVFTMIAIGLALPYLTLSAFPQLIQALPRPGPWMESFKQFMAFLLYATVAFLLWVLAAQLSDFNLFAPFALLALLFALVGIAMAVWIYGRWGALHLSARTRRFAYGISLLTFIAAFSLGWPRAIHAGSEDAPNIVWQTWEPGLAERLAAEGRIVYVDFTARWCVTCQTNKAAVFSSRTVLRTFAEHDIVALQADWTNRNDAITQALAAFNRSAVPFNLIYIPGQTEPIQLPELLTPGIVLNALQPHL